MRNHMLPTLFLSPVLPSSSGSGIEKRAAAHLNALLRLGPVDLVLPMIKPQIDRSPVPPELQGRCRRIDVIMIGNAKSMNIHHLPGLTLFRRLASYGRPRRVVCEAAAAGALADQVRNGDHGLVFCYRLSSFALLTTLISLPLPRSKRLAVDFDDIESNVIERLLRLPDRKSGFEQDLLLRLERVETLRTEQWALDDADWVAVCSELDARTLAARGSKAALRFVPNSFPGLPALPPRPWCPPARALFLGTMTYHPNEDAALYFCQEILPLIRRELNGGITLDIVGKAPSQRVRDLAEAGRVSVVGGVPEVEPHYAAVDFVVVPIRYGGGTRIKILEALALGRPVVSTTIGAEGLDLRDGTDILLADTPADFARHCVALARDPGLRTRLAESGRARFMAFYEADCIQSVLADELSNLFCGAQN